MSASIPLKVQSAPAGNTIGVGLSAITHEILSHLEHLAQTGEGHAIDLKSLPMSPQEFNDLKKLLGEGEIDLTVDFDGPTRIRETGYAGVWWIQHTASNGRILAEYIEIARFPDFLSAQPEHITDAVRQLRDRLQGATP